MKHVLISGGSKGIGKAIVNKFQSEGFIVSYLYNNTEPTDLKENVKAYKCDVKDPQNVKAAIEKIKEDSGDIDVLVSNSGISKTGLATDFSFEDYHMVMDTNFGGLFNLCNSVIPQMVSRKSGVIIAISSMWGQTGASCEALYSASKGAVDAYVKSLAKELGPSGIRVNAVSPGVIKTDMLNEYSENDLKDLADETPIMRLGKPQDIADTVFYLSGSNAEFITGQIIGVNGGFLI